MRIEFNYVLKIFVLSIFIFQTCPLYAKEKDNKELEKINEYLRYELKNK